MKAIRATAVLLAVSAGAIGAAGIPAGAQEIPSGVDGGVGGTVGKTVSELGQKVGDIVKSAAGAVAGELPDNPATEATDQAKAQLDEAMKTLGESLPG
jgi:hypothetical protein